MPKLNGGYTLQYNEGGYGPPKIILDDTGGTTSWRDAKKALRAWYLDQAKALRSVSEKDYFNTGSED